MNTPLFKRIAHPDEQKHRALGGKQTQQLIYFLAGSFDLAHQSAVTTKGDGVQSFQKVAAIIAVPKNIAFFDSSDNHMV